MATIEPVNIECPFCDNKDYLSYDEDYDDEWITLLCECLICHSKFQINYRAVGIDAISPNKEEIEIRKNLRKIFLGLLNRDRDLRIKYDAIINSECGETELNMIVSYLLNKYAPIFEDKILPAGKNKAGYLADVIQVLCAAEA